MKKSLFLYAILGAVLFSWCTNTTTTDTADSSSITCPEWSEYWESNYENWGLKAQWCFKIWESEMEGHWTYYFENWGKDSEWEMINDKREWIWTFYDEEWNNTIEMEWAYKNDLEEWEWKYYIDWEYICSDIFSLWALTDEWTCNREYVEEDFDGSETWEIAEEE
jgi:hypothetical protein